MWDMYGLEAIINVSESEKEAIVEALREGTVKWKNPLQFMILRAKFNTQRNYEIYTVESDLTENYIRELFNTDPQLIADTIRDVGVKVYSDRSDRKPVIT